MFNKNELSVLQSLHQTCKKQNFSFVSFALPYNDKVKTFVQYASKPCVLNGFENIEQESGFLFAPFTIDKHGAYLIEPDAVFDTYTEKIVLPDFSNNEPIKRTLKNNTSSTLKDDFVTQIAYIKRQIVNKLVEKVVLSRINVEQLSADFSITSLFIKLCNSYPHAFKYVIDIPGVGCWMGASPEPLVLMQHDVVKTVALAGTHKLNGILVDDFSWGIKELDEQEIVAKYIESQLKVFGINDYKKSGPTNYKAANVIHLKSTFEFNSDLLKNSLGKWLTALHPSPSVCGLPKEKALDILEFLEWHDRAYYAGVVGTIGNEAGANLYVNLRCMSIDGDKAILYAGAGITAGSNPDAEWDETEQKLQTLLSVMHSSTPVI